MREAANVPDHLSHVDIEEDTDPAGAAVRLVHRLRSRGIAVSTRQTLALVEALASIGFTSLANTRSAARCTLARAPGDYDVIDEELDGLLREIAGAHPVAVGDFSHKSASSGRGAPKTMTAGEADDAQASLGSANQGHEPDDRGGLALYSSLEILRHKDFGAFSADELAQAKTLLRTMRWQPPLRRSRRRRADPRGRELDMRKLLRCTLAHGGEVTALPRRGFEHKPRRLVVLCDVSGSMDTYSRMLLHFLHTLHAHCFGLEVFLFGTRLTRITHRLKRHDPDETIAQLGNEVSDWSGGTRIGESLSTFNRVWARRVMAHGAVTLVISDGWDRGDASRLSSEMARLQRLSHRLIWLNPLLGSSGYRPLTQGMQVALPFIDDFIPAGNLASLEQLAELFNQLP